MLLVIPPSKELSTKRSQVGRVNYKREQRDSFHLLDYIEYDVLPLMRTYIQAVDMAGQQVHPTGAKVS